MKKIQDLFLSKAKKIEKIIAGYQGRLLLLMIIFLIMTIFANLPYFNIILTVSNIVWIMTIIAFFLFNISIRNLFLAALGFLVMAFISVVSGNKNAVEVLGNAIYLIIVIVFLLCMVEYIRQIKRS